ncbi:DUF7848 domain-containing protein [Streptomyces syringium]
MRRLYRHADWTIIQDPNVCAEYSAECSEKGCEAEFSITDDQQTADSWMYDHTARTGHRRFWQTFGNAVVVGPPSWVDCRRIGRRPCERCRASVQTLPALARTGAYHPLEPAASAPV